MLCDLKIYDSVRNINFACLLHFYMAAHNISLLLKEVCRPAEQLLLDAGQRASHLYEDLTQCLFAAPQAYIQRESLYCMSKRYHIHRLYVGGAKSSTDYSFIGWVLTSDVSQCMICNVDFSNDSSKHHCMACGNVVCPNCSPSQGIYLPIYPHTHLHLVPYSVALMTYTLNMYVHVS